jgi:hypothetical protein
LGRNRNQNSRNVPCFQVLLNSVFSASVRDVV